MTLRTFDGAVVYITGAGSGIGRSFAEHLARRGATLVVNDLTLTSAEETASLITKSGGKAFASQLDVRDAAAVKSSIDEAFAKHGRLDYVFANAGMGVFGELQLLEDRDWDMVLGVNLHGVVHTVRAAYPHLLKQGFGHLVNIASLAGLLGTPFLSAYCMAKHGVVGLSLALRAEAQHHGVRVSVICPGPTRTPILTAGAHGRTLYPGFTAERMMAWWKMHGPITELDAFTRDAIRGLEKNEAKIILPKRIRPLLKMLAVVPILADKVATKVYEKTLSRFPEVRARST